MGNDSNSLFLTSDLSVRYIHMNAPGEKKHDSKMQVANGKVGWMEGKMQEVECG